MDELRGMLSMWCGVASTIALNMFTKALHVWVHVTDRVCDGCARSESIGYLQRLMVVDRQNEQHPAWGHHIQTS
jgi:hypothetical protein